MLRRTKVYLEIKITYRFKSIAKLLTLSVVWAKKANDDDCVINDDELLAVEQVILHAFCMVSHKIHGYISASSLPSFCSMGKV